MTQLVIFAGTTEGRLLAEELSGRGISVIACVATDYGRQLIRESANLKVSDQRLDSAEMESLIKASGARLVVDATHPYASLVSENIQTACQLAGVEYLRLVREAGGAGQHRMLADTAAVVDYLNSNNDRVLLTVGSKTLEEFTKVKNFDQRIFARVLPSPEVLKKCAELGLTGRQIIAMQGPFSHQINVAMINDLGIDCLVTKDSGAVGGFYEKLSAVEEAGIKAVIIGRPTKEAGLSLPAIREKLSEYFSLPLSRPVKKSPFFPLFTDLTDKKVVVIGGGKIAERRILKLLEFDAKVVLVSKATTKNIEELSSRGLIEYLEKSYESADLKGAAVVIAATSQRAVNKLVGEHAKALGIPVSVADCREECTFYFPAIVKADNLLAGIISTDGDHDGLRRGAQELRKSWKGRRI